jgi:hypothetical protein
LEWAKIRAGSAVKDVFQGSLPIEAQKLVVGSYPSILSRHGRIKYKVERAGNATKHALEEYMPKRTRERVAKSQQAVNYLLNLVYTNIIDDLCSTEITLNRPH